MKATKTDRRDLEPSDLIRAGELCRRLSIGRSTLWRQTRAGRFPQPIKFSAGCTAWLWADVLAHVKSLRGDRDAE